MKKIRNVFEAFMGSYLLPHERKIVTLVLTLIMVAASAFAGAYLVLQQADVHYDRASNQIVLKLWNTNFYYANQPN